MTDDPRTEKRPQRAYQRLLPHLDSALLTLDDEQALFEETDVESILNRYRQMGVHEVVIKRGAQNCLVQYESALYEIPATAAAKVVDTTAAGDSFSAGYLPTRLHGGTPQQAAAEDHRPAGRVI